MTIRARKIKFLFFIFYLAAIKFVAQNPINIEKNDTLVGIIDSLKETTPTIEISSDFASKVVFWGRDFGRKQFGFENNIIYKTGNGLYFSYTGYIWSAMPNQYAKTDIGIGFEHQFTDRFYGSLGYERWFFNNGDSYVKKALANYLEMNVNYDLDWINIEPSFYYMFGIENVYQTDININSEIYLFSLRKKGKFYLKPQWLTTFANQAFLPIYSDNPTGYANEKKFQLIDFEINASFLFKIRNLEIEPDFHYNIPVRINNEKVSAFFYFSMRIAYNFYFDRGKIRNYYRGLK